MRVRVIAAFATFVCAFATLTSCYREPATLQEGRESASIVSPDAVGRAFIWLPKESTEFGATNSTTYEVWLERVQGGKKQALVLRADATDGVVVRWTAPRDLEICYGPTHISYFNNVFFHAEQYNSSIYRVEIFLRRASSLAACRSAG
jgi:hypothetical protein